MKILYLCTGNSCRSQMAEGWTRALKPEYEVFSAGVERHGMNPYAMKVMAEAGVDISAQYSKTIEELPDTRFDYVVTLCGHAAENCPFFPGPARRIHRGFDDPPQLARQAGTEEEILDAYRKVRDQIRAFVQGLPESLED
ncbi:arsenate reductase ArsC [Salidesulfovibrio onnuriiensis]|uniref:arsenate reductase ArsC n=1 Tax=Salidesulfovibrio onnuriiensis TaxID=2583823 RepID=UPI0011C96322|nr:arsenate reductase ArsC [Salidesulfovibrio onnuriiensis]